MCNLLQSLFVELVHLFQGVFEWHAAVWGVKVENADLLPLEQRQRGKEGGPKLGGGVVAGIGRVHSIETRQIYTELPRCNVAYLVSMLASFRSNFESNCGRH